MTGTESLLPALSKAQRCHLSEMVSPDGKTLYWHPRNQGERSCAAALKEKGLLQGDATTYSSAYFLTNEGMRVALAVICEDADA